MKHLQKNGLCMRYKWQKNEQDFGQLFFLISSVEVHINPVLFALQLPDTDKMSCQND